MCKNNFILFAMLAISSRHHQLAEASHLGLGASSVFGNLPKYLELSQALKYGDDCSWEAEEYRQNFTREKLLNPEVPKAEAALELMDDIVERNYKLCSATKLYSCDKETQKCVCGDPGYEALMGRADRAHFTLEGEDKCRWATTSYCVPADQLVSLAILGIIIDSKCQSGTTCQMVDGELCSIQLIMRNLLQEKGLKFITDARLISEEMMSGRLCTCRVDQMAQSTTEETETARPTDIDSELSMKGDDENLEALFSVFRRKRSLFMPDNYAELSLIPKYVAGLAVRYDG